MDTKQPFPYLTNISLGQNKEGLRDIIKSFDGNVVYIRDFHHGEQYMRAKIKFDKEDTQCYRVETPKGELRLHFGDLEGLLSPF